MELPKLSFSMRVGCFQREVYAHLIIWLASHPKVTCTINKGGSALCNVKCSNLRYPLQICSWKAPRLEWPRPYGKLRVRKTAAPGNSHHRVSWFFRHNRIRKVCSLEYTDIQKVFLTPQHGRRRQQRKQGNSKRNSRNRANNGILGHCCTVTRGHCCVTMYSMTLCHFCTVSRGYSLVKLCSNNDLGPIVASNATDGQARIGT
jgi:hypothetical protein